MNKICLCLCLCLCYGCINEKRKIKEVVPIKNEVKVISLNPLENKKINLSDIVSSINIKILETSENSLIGNIGKIEVADRNYSILNEHDKLVYAFDSTGSFRCRIGKKGNGPGEIQFPECFAVNRKKKEIWMTNNFQSIYKYNYDGDYIESMKLDLKFRDFMITDDGYLYFHASKLMNFTTNRESICWNLWIMNTANEFTTCFPYDSLIYSNGGLYFDTKIPFNELSNSISYNYVFNDTIFSLIQNNIAPRYLIDFGPKKSKVNLSSITGEDALKYFQNNPDRACYVQNFIENNYILRFNYIMGTQLYDVFLYKENDVIVEGILVNDIFDAHIEFKQCSKDKLIGFMNASEIKINDKTSTFIDNETINKLRNLKEDDNPILIEIIIKNSI